LAKNMTTNTNDVLVGIYIHSHQRSNNEESRDN
jgi:hypothetical protein